MLGAIAVGFGVWLLPSFTDSKVYRELIAKQTELRERREKIEAVQAEIKAERERLGLVYVEPVRVISPDAPKPPVSGTPAQ